MAVNEKQKDSPWLFVSLLFIVASLIWMIFAGNRILKNGPLKEAYIEKHQCKRSGFTGERSPQAIYNCDNGIWLENEIRNKAWAER